MSNWPFKDRENRRCLRPTTADSREFDQRNCQLHSDADRSLRRGGDNRSETHVHDDARGTKAKFSDENILHAGGVSKEPKHKERIFIAY